MILLDAYGLLALLLDEQAAEDVETLLRGPSGVAIPSVNLFEVIDYLVRRERWPEDEVRGELTAVLDEMLRVLDVSADVAWRAALLRARHYVRDTCEVSLADCILLGSAGAGDTIATADPSVASVARTLGIELAALPDSRGRRP